MVEQAAAEEFLLMDEEREAKVEAEGKSAPTVAEIMGCDTAATKAVVLRPVEGTMAGGSFELWESGSGHKANV